MHDALALILRATGRPAAPDQTFRELGFDGIDRLCIADEVETALCCELTQREVDAWHSVADVAASIEFAAKWAALCYASKTK